MKLRMLIVDDEELARNKLKTFLAGLPYAKVVGEAADGETAAALVRKLHPDVIFLDIQIPNFSGLEVSRQLPPSAKVIFTTAYRRYAVDAFVAGSVDYLLKPWSRERFLLAMDRLRARVRQERSAAFLDDMLPVLPLEAVLESTTSAARGKLLFRTKERVAAEAIQNIAYIRADGNYLSIQTAQQRYYVRGTLERIQTELDPQTFVQIHRSHCINLAFVRDLRPSHRGAIDVIMENGARLRASRVHAAGLMTSLQRAGLPVIGRRSGSTSVQSPPQPDRQRP